MGTEKLKMPPVSTAIAQRRSRKTSQQDSLILTAKGKLSTNAQTNITESQKRIRQILDKNLLDRSMVSSAVTSDMDALGSYCIKQNPPHQLTNRDLKSLEEAQSLNKSQHYDKEQREQIAIEVTDRLYNKKQIKKMRKQNAKAGVVVHKEHDHGRHESQTGTEKDRGHSKKSKKHKTHVSQETAVSPKGPHASVQHQPSRGQEYLLGNKFAEAAIKKADKNIAEIKTTTLNSSAGPRSQKRQQMPHNALAGKVGLLT